MEHFVKYPSIVNVHELSIGDAMDELRAFNAEHVKSWCVTEKIDGANIQLAVKRGDGLRVGRRNAYLEDGCDFYGLWKNIPKIDSVIEALRRYVDDENNGANGVTLYGEYFGDRIMRRLDYGTDYAFLFFSVFVYDDIAGGWLSESRFRRFMAENGILDYAVPLVASGITLDEALAFECDGKSAINGNCDREGIIIEPWEYVADNPRLGRGHVYKHKTEVFMETRTFPQDKSVDLALFERQKREFRDFCTENRMFSVFSKLGMPSSPKDTGRYLAAFNDDAWEDFLKLHPEYEFRDTGYTRSVRNIGSMGYIVFKNVESALAGGKNGA